MKVEGEFGYEPSLLVYMELHQRMRLMLDNPEKTARPLATLKAALPFKVDRW
jgi:hypothetical protein